MEKHIELFSCKGKVIICGDLNAKVGAKTNFIQNDEDEYTPLPNDLSHEFILPRVSCDKKPVNQHGRWLLDLCSDNQLYIPKMWTEKDRVNYQKALNSLEVQCKLKGIDKQLGYDSIDINSIVDQITEIMVLEGNKSLRRRSFRMKKKNIGSEKKMV